MSNSIRSVAGLKMNVARGAKVKRNTRKHLRLYEIAQRKKKQYGGALRRP
jgi:hypothetical protein